MRIAPLFNEAQESLFSRDEVHQVVGRCSLAQDTFTHVSSLRLAPVLVGAALGLEGSPNLVTRMSPRHAARGGPPYGRPRPGAGLAAVAPVRPERRVLARLSKGWDNAHIGQDLIHQPAHRPH